MTFDGRDKLHLCTFKAEICNGSWMKVLQEYDVLLTNNFHTAYEELKIYVDDLVGEDEVIDCILHDNHGI